MQIVGILKKSLRGGVPKLFRSKGQNVIWSRFAGQIQEFFAFHEIANLDLNEVMEQLFWLVT